MWIFSSDASSTGHVSLPCRLSIPEAKYRSSNDRLGKDNLFLVIPVWYSAVQKILSQMEPSKLASGAASLNHFSPVPRLSVQFLGSQSSSQANTIMVLSYSKLGTVWHNRMLNIYGAFGHSTKL